MFKNIWITTLPILFMVGCGSNETKNNIQTHIQKNLDTKSKAYYGYLADATVQIYRLDNGVKKILFTEKTSNGENLQSIGNFKSHFADLSPNTFYQFEISGGLNWDADNDGIKDQMPSLNTNKYIAVYKGHQLHISWWKKSAVSKTGASE